MATPAKSSRKNFMVVGLLSLLILVSFGFLILLSLSSVEGEEFSPDDFSRRHFSYLRLPGLNWVLRGKEYKTISSDIEESLTSEGLIVARPANTWHLCREGYSQPQPAECDARFLVRLLTLPSEKPEHPFYWQQWNEEHPELAKRFWPLVAELARDEMYLSAPNFMKLAMEIDSQNKLPSPDQFQQLLHQHLAESYQQFGELDRAQGRLERADYRCRRAAEFRTKLNEDARVDLPRP